MLTRAAPAKLNLSLHITGRRADGYHLLESVVAFTGLADTLEFTHAAELSLEVEGPFAEMAGSDADNLVRKAAQALQAHSGYMGGAHIKLSKHIPAGAGLGGGSSDAAATLLGLNELWQLGLDIPALAALGLTLGADVPMFLHAPQPLLVRGIGEDIAPLPIALPRWHTLLVHPRVALPTVQVYRRYEHHARGGQALPLAPDAWLVSLRQARNDLQAPAIGCEPAVAEILLALETLPVPPLLARMSGSGACCFGLYETSEEASTACRVITRDCPHWWAQTAAILS